MNYSGIHLHSNNSVASVIDETDRVVAEKHLPNELAKVLAFLAPWRVELAGVVVESTFNSYWLVDGLQAAGYVIHLANTIAIRKYDGLKQSGDETDARYLAHPLLLGILPTGTVLPPKHREIRDLARKRMQLVRSCTSHILAVENITARQYGTRITSNQVKRGSTRPQAVSCRSHQRPFGISQQGVGRALQPTISAVDQTLARLAPPTSWDETP
nr:transposase [Paraburkholderia phenoliruptrix]